MTGLPVPAASAGPEALADWAELTAISAADRNISFEDIAEEIRRAGSTDALAGDDASASVSVDQRSETTEAVVDAVFMEFDERARSSGPSNAYPFKVEAQVLQGPRRPASSTYMFLLLLSYFGKDAVVAADKPERLFEDVAAVALRSYMGPAEGTELFKLGHPRREEDASFRQAVNDLCERLGEGVGVVDHARAGDMNDAKVDLIAWRPFPDRRMGKVIAYGQCSTSGRWADHLRLVPSAFNNLWLRGPVHSPCVCASFFPQRIERDRWREAVEYGKVAFDRCRISHFACRLEASLRESTTSWSRLVINEKLR